MREILPGCPLQREGGLAAEWDGEVVPVVDGSVLPIVGDVQLPVGMELVVLGGLGRVVQALRHADVFCFRPPTAQFDEERTFGSRLSLCSQLRCNLPGDQSLDLVVVVQVRQ